MSVFIKKEKEATNKIHVKKILDFLITEGIKKEEIAIKTGVQDQITGIDLFSKTCPIRYIITVNALKEGWDNSFAYVLISVANIGARISVEQTIGRIIRLPNTKEKVHEELNVSYVFTSSTNFSNAAKEVEEGLLANGYSRKDIKILTNNEIPKSNFYKQTILDNDIKIPYIAIDKKQPRPIEFFEDLVGAHFDLTKQKLPDNFEMYYDQDRTQKIDIKEGDQFDLSIQTRLNIIYDFKDFTKDELLNWLDRKVLRKEYTQEDKRKFFEIVIDRLLSSRKYNLSELSINCYKLKNVIEMQIRDKELKTAKQNFSGFEMSNSLLLNSIFHKFQPQIEIDNISDEKFGRHLYEMSGDLNKEQLILSLKIDQLDNIYWWYRNIEKRDWYIQGWQHDRFYPDFIIRTNAGNYIIVEYKGENLLTNEDTKYKKELGEKWASLAGKKYHFLLAHENNLDEIIKGIQKL